MFLRTQTLPETKLIGQSMTMSFAAIKTPELWRGFMPRRKEIDSIGTALYSAEVFDPDFFDSFDANKTFEKWAAVAVANFDHIPQGMQTLVFPQGLYAVFLHKGPAANAAVTYNHIFTQWLPDSGFSIDGRPHFAIMDEKYQPNSADSEEEIWIPIR